MTEPQNRRTLPLLGAAWLALALLHFVLQLLAPRNVLGYAVWEDDGRSEEDIRIGKVTETPPPVGGVKFEQAMYVLRKSGLVGPELLREDRGAPTTLVRRER